MKVFRELSKKSTYYESIFVNDLIFYLDEAYRFEPAFLRIAFYFTAWVMRSSDKSYSKVLGSLMRSAIKHFDDLTLDDLALACYFSERLRLNQSATPILKEDFVRKLEPRVIQYVDSGDFKKERNARHIAINLILGM